jgi:hypothetical protein
MCLIYHCRGKSKGVKRKKSACDIS